MTVTHSRLFYQITLEIDDERERNEFLAIRSKLHVYKGDIKWEKKNPYVEFRANQRSQNKLFRRKRCVLR